MGQARRKALAARKGAGDEPAEPQVVDTLGGRMHMRWDEGAAATPHGQLVFLRSSWQPLGCSSAGCPSARCLIAAATPLTSATC